MSSPSKRSRSTRRRAVFSNGVGSASITLPELAKLGGGEVAYIKHMRPGLAKKLFPSIKGLPQGIELFSLHAADGTPIAITDTRNACVEHARGDQLQIASVH